MQSLRDTQKLLFFKFHFEFSVMGSERRNYSRAIDVTKDRLIGYVPSNAEGGDLFRMGNTQTHYRVLGTFFAGDGNNVVVREFDEEIDGHLDQNRMYDTIIPPKVMGVSSIHTKRCMKVKHRRHH
jgi:hypothetical protein